MSIFRSALVRPAVALLLGAAFAPLAYSAHAADQSEQLGPNIVANGGFEIGSNPGVQLAIPVGAPFLSNWTPVGNEVRVVGTGWQAEEGARSMSLGNWGANSATPPAFPTGASGIKQTLTTKVGQHYRVVFYQAGNPFDHNPEVLRIQLGGVTKDFTYQSDLKAKPHAMEWVRRSFVFTATAAGTPLAFYAYYTPGNDPLGLDNVQVRAIQTAPGAGPETGTPQPVPAASTAILHFRSASIAAGGQQMLEITAAASAAVAVILDYPDGTQVVVPGHAGADGKYTYSWTLAASVHGTVHVTVDSASSVVQGSFSVS